MRLRWKLTLSYTLVTAGAILLIEIGLLAVAAFLLTRADALPRILVPILSDATAELAPALEATPPHRAALETWLEVLVKEGRLARPDQDGLKLNLNPASLQWAVVTDAQGEFVAAYPQPPCGQGKALAACLPPEALTLTGRALAGERNSGQLSFADEQGLYAAAPITDAAGHTVGVLLLRIAWPASLRQWPREVVGTLLPSAALITLFAALIGTLFGFLTARGLTRRLTALTAAADAWSRGDFSAQVRDPSPDELGALARRLNRMAEQLENLVHSRQALAALEERNRLARDLHDAVKQQVFAAGMQLAAARRLLPQQPEAAQDAVAQADALIRQAQQELTALIQELRPAALQNKGLVATLREHLEAWASQTGIAADFRVQHEQRLPLETAQALLRVAQEALANTARHSRARHVRVRLTWSENAVRLTVEDDGQGFDAAAVQGQGLGLTSMAERVQTLGGHLEVVTRPGGGTRIEATIPLTPP
ncbi:MAG TPA: HAMP domain-containing protein [Chloroflexi bacterium]|nr:HAMP domain-containing protein [Chloroflexota bacterium]